LFPDFEKTTITKMKKISLLLGLIAFGLSQAQAQASFWSEDFKNGIPSGWLNTGVDGSGTTRNGMWKSNKTGNHGAFSANAIINSPTKANGFIIFDSDSLDNTGTGAFGSGPAPARQRGALTTTSINCTGHNNISLNFYQLFFGFSTSCRVVINAGAASDTIEVNADLDFPFAGTTNPNAKHYDISAIAGNQANVTLTFLWDNGLYYYWQVDDISLNDIPANDMAITNAGSFDFYSYPISQFDSFTWGARGKNLGANTQTSVKASIKIVKVTGGSTVYTDSTTPVAALLSGIDTAMNGSKAFVPVTPLTKGNYRSILTVKSDSTEPITYNNADTTIFTISDSILAIDNGLYGGQFDIFNAGTNPPANNEWVNVFTTTHDDTLSSIIASFDPFTNATASTGGTVKAVIYSVDAGFTTPTKILETETKKITTANLPGAGNNRVRPITFVVDKRSGNPILPAGNYAVSIVSVSNDSNVVLTNTQRKIAGSRSGEISGGGFIFYRNTQFYIRMSFGKINLLYCSYLRLPSVSKTNLPTYYNGTAFNASPSVLYAWDYTNLTNGNLERIVAPRAASRDTIIYTTTDSFNVCLTVTDGPATDKFCAKTYVKQGPTLGVENVTPATITLTPNPSIGNINFNAEGLSGDVSITFTNIAGQEVKQINETASGNFKKSYDVSDLTNGIYLVKIQNGDNTFTRRLTINK
jgi:Secretion system C-terminal sorting domain